MVFYVYCSGNSLWLWFSEDFYAIDVYGIVSVEARLVHQAAYKVVKLHTQLVTCSRWLSVMSTTGLYIIGLVINKIHASLPVLY